MLGGGGSGGEVFGWCFGHPVVREEFLEPFGWVGADALEYIAEVGERVDLESLAGGDEAGQDGGGSPTVIAAEEQPVLPSESHCPQGALGAIGLDVKMSLLAVADQDFPVLLAPPHAAADRDLPRDGHPLTDAKNATVHVHSPGTEINAIILDNSSGNDKYCRVRTAYRILSGVFRIKRVALGKKVGRRIPIAGVTILE
jgi:hypothetical protein